MFRRLPWGAVPFYAPLCLDANDVHTQKCAFLKRLLRDVPQYDPMFLRSFKKYVKKMLRRYVPPVMPMDFEDWLADTDYNESDKAQLRDAHEALCGAPPSKHQRSHISTFIKVEPYPSWKQARMINSRCDAMKVYAGPAIKSIEKVVYDIDFDGIRFIKHVPVPQRPREIMNLISPGANYYSTDFTAFESHFTPAIMETCELALIRHCCKGMELAEVLCDAYSGMNKMHMRNGLTATVEGRRMSGDMHTSLGNGFTNAMLVSYLCHLKHHKVRGFVEGDDGIFATCATLDTHDYEVLGFTIKMEKVESPCEASFCGMVFSASGEILRDPRKFMMSFGWTHSMIMAGSKVMHQLLRAKALSAAYETPQCPIVGAFAHVALQKTQGYVARWVRDGYHEHPRDESFLQPFCPSYDTRVLFQRVYGVSIELQVAIERCVFEDRLDEIPFLLVPGNDCYDYSTRFLHAL